MKFTIGVTHYNEPWEVVKPLFDSIQMQRGINRKDFEVVLVNDGEEGALGPQLFKGYSYEVRQFVNPKATVSAARNRCINEAKGDFIELCDCDDAFYSPTAFWMLFREMEVGFDGLVSAFIEEGKDPITKNFVYIPHEQPDGTFVHGKVYRTAYLKENNIYFDDALSIHEDSRFNLLAQNCSKNIKFCPIAFYLWQWQDNSVCRRDPKYILKTMKNMIWSNTSLVEEFIKRDMEDKAAYFVAFMVVDGYYLMNCKNWKDTENKEYRKSTFNEYKKYYKKYKKLYEKMSQQDILTISNGVRQRHIMEGNFEMEDMLYDDWMKMINK